MKNVIAFCLALWGVGSLVAMNEYVPDCRQVFPFKSDEEIRLFTWIKYETKAVVSRDVTLYVVCREIKRSDSGIEFYFCRENKQGVLEFFKQTQSEVDSFFKKKVISLFPAVATKKSSAKTDRPVFNGLRNALLVQKRTITIIYIEIPLCKDGRVHPERSAKGLSELILSIEKTSNQSCPCLNDFSSRQIRKNTEKFLDEISLEMDSKEKPQKGPYNCESLSKKFSCEISDNGILDKIKEEGFRDLREEMDNQCDFTSNIKLILSGGDYTDVISGLDKKHSFYLLNIGPMERVGVFSTLKYPLKHCRFVANIRSGNGKATVEMDSRKKKNSKGLPVIEVTVPNPFSLTGLSNAIDLLTEEKFF
jgi:hypothetical protein